MLVDKVDLDILQKYLKGTEVIYHSIEHFVGSKCCTRLINNLYRKNVTNERLYLKYMIVITKICINFVNVFSFMHVTLSFPNYISFKKAIEVLQLSWLAFFKCQIHVGVHWHWKCTSEWGNSWKLIEVQWKVYSKIIQWWKGYVCSIISSEVIILYQSFDWNLRTLQV